MKYKSDGINEVDICRMAECEAEYFSDAGTTNSISSLLSVGGRAVIAYDGETLCGYGYISVSPFESELLRIAVCEGYRKRGIAREILKRLHDIARNSGSCEMFLEVRQSNESAISLYRSFGYEQVGIRKNFYRLPCEDALIFRKELNNQQD